MAVSSRPVPYFTVDSPLNEGIQTVQGTLEPSDQLAANAMVSDVPGFEATGLESVHVRMAVVLSGMAMVGFLLLQLLSRNVSVADGAAAMIGEVADSGVAEAEAAAQEAAAGGAIGVLSPLFTPEVLHWEPRIVAWSAQYGVDPNLAAIIMQIESCGDPGAVSSAGAQGLFQVMPFHFVAGENPQDPDTNAARGLKYFTDRLVQTNGDVGRAFAGYNGGHVAAAVLFVVYRHLWGHHVWGRYESDPSALVGGRRGWIMQAGGR
jgi:hypothetical protein